MGWQLLADNWLLCWGGLCSWLFLGEEQAHLHLQGSVGVKGDCITAAVAEVSSYHGKHRPMSQRAGKNQKVKKQMGVH